MYQKIFLLQGRFLDPLNVQNVSFLRRKNCTHFTLRQEISFECFKHFSLATGSLRRILRAEESEPSGISISEKPGAWEQGQNSDDHNSACITGTMNLE